MALAGWIVWPSSPPDLGVSILRDRHRRRQRPVLIVAEVLLQLARRDRIRQRMPRSGMIRIMRLKGVGQQTRRLLPLSQIATSRALTVPIMCCKCLDRTIIEYTAKDPFREYGPIGRPPALHLPGPRGPDDCCRQTSIGANHPMSSDAARWAIAWRAPAGA